MAMVHVHGLSKNPAASKTGGLTTNLSRTEQVKLIDSPFDLHRPDSTVPQLFVKLH